MVEDLFYFDSGSVCFIVLSIILSILYLIIIVLSVLKIKNLPSAYYKKSMIFLLSMIILISACNYYLVRVIKSLQFLLKMRKNTRDIIALCPLFMYFYIFAINSHIIFDLHISLSDSNEYKKKTASKMFKIFLVVASLLSTLVAVFIVLIEVYKQFIFLYATIVAQVIVTVILSLDVLAFSLHCAKVENAVNKFFSREFGKDISKNIRFLILIYIFSTAMCIILFNVTFYSFLWINEVLK